MLINNQTCQKILSVTTQTLQVKPSNNPSLLFAAQAVSVKDGYAAASTSINGAG
jgi:hypothetical protein